MGDAEAMSDTLGGGEAWAEAFSQLGRFGFSGIMSLLGLGLWMAWVWFALNGRIPLYGQGTYEIAAPTITLGFLALTMFVCAFSTKALFLLRPKWTPLIAGGLAALGCVELIFEAQGLLPASLSCVAAAFCGCGAALLLFLFGLSFCRLDAGPALVAFIGCILVCFLGHFCLSSIGETGGDVLFVLLPLATALTLYTDHNRIVERGLRGIPAGSEALPDCGNTNKAAREPLDPTSGVPQGLRRLFLACFTYFAAISFTHAMAPIEEHGFASDAGVVCTLFIGLVVLAIYVTRRRTFRILKACYALSVMLVLFANTVAPFTGDTNLAYEALRNASYFILFMVVWLLLSWVASYGEVPARQVFGIAFFLVGLGMAVGWVGGICLHLRFGDTRDAFTMGVGLVVVAFFSVGFNVRDFPRLVTRSQRCAHAEKPREIDELAGDLSPRERDVFAYLAQGYGSEYIAEQLGVSYHTVRAHVRSIYKKLDIHSREELLDKVRS